jgi:hypothetical protein
MSDRAPAMTGGVVAENNAIVTLPGIVSIKGRKMNDLLKLTLQFRYSIIEAEILFSGDIAHRPKT